MTKNNSFYYSQNADESFFSICLGLSWFMPAVTYPNRVAAFDAPAATDEPDEPRTFLYLPMVTNEDTTSNRTEELLQKNQKHQAAPTMQATTLIDRHSLFVRSGRQFERANSFQEQRRYI